MKIMLRILLFLFCFSEEVFSQDALVMLKFEEAEKSFNSGEYEASLRLLDEVESEVGTTSKTLFLKIMAEKALFGYGANLQKELANFNRLQRLREHISAYLAAMGEAGLDDRYRAVYKLSEELSSYPKNKNEWAVLHKKYVAESEKELAEEKSRLKQEAMQKEKQSELLAYMNGKIAAEALKYHELSTIVSPDSQDACTVILYKSKDDPYDKGGTFIYVNGSFHVLLFKKYLKLKVSPGILKLNGLPYVLGKGMSKYFKTGEISAEMQPVYDQSNLMLLPLQSSATYIRVDQQKRAVVFSRVGEVEARSYLNAKNIKEGQLEDFPEPSFLD